MNIRELFPKHQEPRLLRGMPKSTGIEISETALGKSIVLLVMDLTQQLADEMKAHKKTEKKMQEVIDQKMETIRQLNNAIFELKDQLSIIQHGRPLNDSEKTFKLEELLHGRK